MALGLAHDFDAFFTATHGRIVSQIYAMTGSPHEAEDSVQEACARAWQRWATLSSEAGNPKAWVRTVATRLAVSSWRKAVNRLKAHRRERPPAEVPGMNPDHIAVIAAARTRPTRPSPVEGGSDRVQGLRHHTLRRPGPRGAGRASPRARARVPVRRRARPPARARVRPRSTHRQLNCRAVQSQSKPPGLAVPWRPGVTGADCSKRRATARTRGPSWITTVDSTMPAAGWCRRTERIIEREANLGTRRSAAAKASAGP